MWSAQLPDKIYARMGAFSLVGVANTIAGVSVIAIASVLGANAVLANIFGYGTGLFVSFAFNSRFTFHGRAANRSTAFRFLGTWAIAFVANIGVVYLTTTIFGYHGLFASLAGAPLFTSIFFVLCEYWVFRPKSRNVPE